MKHMKILTLLLVLSTAMTCSIAGADESGNFLPTLVPKVVKAMALVQCEITNDAGSQVISGTAVCIDQNSGLMMTMVLNARLKPETISKLEVLLPGKPATRVEAKLLGIDPVTGISFLQVPGQKFSAIAFMKQANVSIGQRVASVCLSGNSSRVSPVLGTGFVSSKEQMPDWRYFITGGSLSQPGSVVFDSQGRAIGMVGTQPYQRFQATSKRGPMPLSLKNDEHTFSFQPAEEFVYVLQNIPQDGKVRRMPWLGIINFTPVEPAIASAKGINTPAIMIGQIVPGSQADKAGLVNRDIVVALNGEPFKEFGSPNLTVSAFMRSIAKLGLGKTVKLTVFSGPKKRNVNVKLTPMPKLPSEASTLLSKELGMLLREKVPMDQYVDTNPAGAVPGLLVLAMGEKSPAAKGGLEKGDVITKINGTMIGTADDGKEAFNKALKQQASTKIELVVRRGLEDKKLTIDISGVKR